MGCRGWENLKTMKKDTLGITTDGQGRKYIHQITSEHDQNHTKNDTDKDNKARIYQQLGMSTHLSNKSFTFRSTPKLIKQT